MRLVADTSELFSFFNEKSKAREISLIPEFELHSPSFFLDELYEHKAKLLACFSLSETQFLLVKKLLATIVRVAHENEYSEFLPKAMKISPDPDDIDFFALALKLGCPIWSEDKLLKKQSNVRIFSTDDLMELLGYMRP